MNLTGEGMLGVDWLLTTLAALTGGIIWFTSIGRRGTPPIVVGCDITIGLMWMALSIRWYAMLAVGGDPQIGLPAIIVIATMAVAHIVRALSWLFRQAER